MRLEARLASLEANNTASPHKKKVVVVAPEIKPRAPHAPDSEQGGNHLRLMLNQESTAIASAANVEHELGGRVRGARDSFAVHKERMHRKRSDTAPPQGQNLAAMRFNDPATEPGPGPLALYQPKAPPPGRPGRRAVDSIVLHTRKVVNSPRAIPHGGS
jgi:hypothetical protein